MKILRWSSWPTHSQSLRELVKLSLLCHSRMEDILPKDTSIRLIAFNLGYLPGGDKTIITKPHTTLLALQAAGRIIASGGLISIVVYVGHPGGREESEAVLSFVSSLPEEGWNSFKFETANRNSMLFKIVTERLVKVKRCCYSFSVRRSVFLDI